MDNLSSKYISRFASGFKSEQYVKNKFARDIRIICKHLDDQNQHSILSSITPYVSKQLDYNILYTHTLVSTLFLLHLLFDCFSTESYTEDGNRLLISFGKIIHFYRKQRNGLLHCTTSNLNIYQPTIGLGAAYNPQLYSGLFYINNKLHPTLEDHSLRVVFNELMMTSVSLGEYYQMAKQPNYECNLANYVDQYPDDLPILIPLTTVRFDVIGILLSNIILVGLLVKTLMAKIHLKKETRNCTNYFYSLQPLTKFAPQLVDYFGICGSILSIDPIDTIPLLTISANNVAAQPKTLIMQQETKKLNQVLKKLTDKPNRPKQTNRTNYLCLVIIFVGILSNLVYTNTKSKKLFIYNTKETIETNDTHMVTSSLTLIVLGFVLHFVLKMTNTNKSKNQKMLKFTYSKQ